MCLPIVGKALYDEGALIGCHFAASRDPACAPLMPSDARCCATTSCSYRILTFHVASLSSLIAGLSGLMKGQPLSDFPEARRQSLRALSSQRLDLWTISSQKSSLVSLICADGSACVVPVLLQAGTALCEAAGKAGCCGGAFLEARQPRLNEA